MAIRTDLAVEANEMLKDTGEGVRVKTEEENGIKLTRLDITNNTGAESLGKPVGRYVTIECAEIKYSVELYEKTCRKIAEEIRGMARLKENFKTLVVGLGNREITPDALGSEVVAKLMVTGHIKEYKNDLLSDEISAVYAIAPGVLGTTGIESAEIIEAIVKKVKPDLVIAIDALASRSLDRISTTFQLSDTGISPGSGVENKRRALNRETLGVEVIAIGVPTVVDAATVAIESMDLGSESGYDEQKKEELIRNMLAKDIAGLMVTPKDIDLVIEKASKTIANGINLALHQNLTFEDIESYVG